MEAQANTPVNYRKWKRKRQRKKWNFFISLRLYLRSRLHFTRVNRGNAKANARKMKNTRFMPSNQGGVLQGDI